MINHITSETIGILTIFSLLSILVCTAQIILRKKFRFFTLCKVTIFFPLLTVIISATWGMSLALLDIAKANDLSGPIFHQGMSVLLASISVGLIVTIFLAVFYAITKAVCEN